MKSSNKIFISYSWKNKELVDVIERKFVSIGVEFTRDVNDLKFKDSLTSFMDSIRDHEFAIVFLTNDYLRSENCLYELLEYYKEKDFYDRVVPIYHDLNIFNYKGRVSVIQYWNNKLIDVRNTLKKIDPVKNSAEFSKAKIIEFITSNISDFLTNVIDQKITSYDECIENNFETLIEFLGLENRKITNEILKMDKIENLLERESELEKLYLKYPENREISLYRADFINKFRNNLRQALIIYQKLLENYPNYTFLLNKIAEVYLRLENTSKAEKYINKSKKLAPTNPNNLLKIGQLLGELCLKFGKQDLWIEGVEILERAKKLTPDKYKVYYQLAELYVIKPEKIETAKENYLKAIELNKNYLPPYTNAIVLSFETGDEEVGYSLLDQAKKIFGDEPTIIFAEAMQMLKSGRINIAKNILTELIKKFPQVDYLYVQLARINHEIEGNTLKALEVLELGRKESSQDFFINIYLSKIINELNVEQVDELLIKLHKYLSKEDYNKAHLLIVDNKIDPSKKYSTIMYQIYNQWGLQLKELADNTYDKSNKRAYLKQSMIKFEHAIKCDEDQFHAWCNLAISSGDLLRTKYDEDFRIEEIEEVINFYKHAIALKKDSPLLWGNLAMFKAQKLVFSELNKNPETFFSTLDEAIKDNNKALSFNDKFFPAQHNAGRFEYVYAIHLEDDLRESKLYHLNLAIIHFEIASNLEPSSGENWMLLGDSLITFADLQTNSLEKKKLGNLYFKAYKSYKSCFDIKPEIEVLISLTKCLYLASIYFEENSFADEAGNYLNKIKNLDFDLNNVIGKDQNWKIIAEKINLLL